MKTNQVKLNFWLSVILLSFLSAHSLKAASSNSNLPVEEVRLLHSVLEYIKGAYVDEKTDKELIRAAITGMAKSLDPHSSYLEPKAFDDLKTSTKGEFGGLGIEVSMNKEGFIKIVSPIDDTPAQRADLQPADVIIRLDDEPVQGMTLQEAVEIMRGKPGTDIELTIVRKGVDKPLTKTLIREIIQVRSIRSELLEQNILYIRLSRFQEPTSDQLIKAIKESQSSGKEVSGIILDLRNNPGGILNTAIAVSGVFLDGVVVVSTKGRLKNQNKTFKANKGTVVTDIPVVVLINEGSASASEIVAGALQDHGRAIIMGRKSFGKGSVQTLFPLDKDDNSHGLKLTTARFYTPKGHAIQARGITPDVRIPLLEVKERAGFKRVKEDNLKGHLSAEGGAEPNQIPGEDDKKRTAEELVDTDYELSQAINMIKGLTWKDKAKLEIK